MILTCTSCLTRYYADDASIGATGRSVRCAACGHTWFAEPVLALEEPSAARPAPLTRERVERMRKAAASEPGPAPSAAALYRAQQSEKMRQERGRAAAFAWAGTGAAIAASAAGAVVFRNEVAEFWPQSASAYAAVGLDVNVYGLELNDLIVERSFEGPTPVLLISGEVRNIGRDAKQSPPLRITLRDGESNELYEVVQSVDGAEIAPGEALPFQVRVENPPADAVDLEAAFASYGEAPAIARAPQAPLVDMDGALVLGPEQEVRGEPQAVNIESPGLRLDTSADTEGHG